MFQKNKIIFNLMQQKIISIYIVFEKSKSKKSNFTNKIYEKIQKITTYKKVELLKTISTFLIV